MGGKNHLVILAGDYTKKEKKRMRKESLKENKFLLRTSSGEYLAQHLIREAERSFFDNVMLVASPNVAEHIQLGRTKLVPQQGSFIENLVAGLDDASAKGDGKILVRYGDLFCLRRESLETTMQSWAEMEDKEKRRIDLFLEVISEEEFERHERFRELFPYFPYLPLLVNRKKGFYKQANGFGVHTAFYRGLSRELMISLGSELFSLRDLSGRSRYYLEIAKSVLGRGSLARKLKELGYWDNYLGKTRNKWEIIKMLYSIVRLRKYKRRIFSGKEEWDENRFGWNFSNVDVKKIEKTLSGIIRGYVRINTNSPHIENALDPDYVHEARAFTQHFSTLMKWVKSSIASAFVYAEKNITDYLASKGERLGSYA